MATTTDDDRVERRDRRRSAKRSQILATAWELARRDSPAAISLHELATLVDMRQPSLYAYFDSKHDLYDAMFAEGFRALIEERRALVPDPDPVLALRQGARHFVDFCLADPARYQLLFQRSIPGFVPSPASLALSVEALDYLRRWLAAVGLDDPVAVDLIRPLLVGLAGEQIANDPGGDRWVRHLDDVVEVFIGVMERQR
jgi:AcrR family transcriptional regulator